MHGKSNNPALLGDATANRLPYPPRAVCGELKALRVVELLDGPNKTGVAFLHQIQKGHLRTAVLSSNRNNQAKVGRHKMLHCPLAFFHQELQLLLGRTLGALSTFGERHVAGEDVLCVKTNFDGLRQFDFLFSGQQWSPGDAFQI